MDDQQPEVSLSTASKTYTAIGLAAGLAPFMFSSSSSSSSTVNGQITDFHYRDNFALVGGAVAILCGVLAMVAERKPSLQRSKRLMIAVAVLALGAWQIARGLGVFASPG